MVKAVARLLAELLLCLPPPARADPAPPPAVAPSGAAGGRDPQLVAALEVDAATGGGP
jgi:hypothetical protein